MTFNKLISCSLQSVGWSTSNEGILDVVRGTHLRVDFGTQAIHAKASLATAGVKAEMCCHLSWYHQRVLNSSQCQVSKLWSHDFSPIIIEVSRIFFSILLLSCHESCSSSASFSPWVKSKDHLIMFSREISSIISLTNSRESPGCFSSFLVSLLVSLLVSSVLPVESSVVAFLSNSCPSRCSCRLEGKVMMRAILLFLESRLLFHLPLDSFSDSFDGHLRAGLLWCKGCICCLSDTVALSLSVKRFDGFCLNSSPTSLDMIHCKTCDCRCCLNSMVLW